MKPILAGIRILSLAEQFPGPFATMLLADLGADVILVERPHGGDPSRRFTGHFESLNRNKRSICLNLKAEEGCDVFLKLVDTADIVIEGFRPGVMARLGLGPDVLRARKPALIFMSVSSFGQTGPLVNVAGHDLSIQGAAGLIDVPAGNEHDATLPVLPLADIASANYAALGLVAALFQRERSGQGAYLDVSMLDSLVSWMTPLLVPAMNGTIPAPLPPQEPGYGLFATQDGRQITLSIAGEDHLWKELCRVLELAEFGGLDESQRIANRAAILPRLRDAIRRKPIEWLIERFEERKIAFGIVRRASEVADDPQVVARAMIQSLTVDGKTRRYVNQPLLIDGTVTRIVRPAPALGEHTSEVLKSLGYAELDVRQMRCAGIAGPPGSTR